MSLRPKFAAAKRVGFALKHASSSKPDSRDGSGSISNRGAELFAHEAKIPANYRSGRHGNSAIPLNVKPTKRPYPRNKPIQDSLIRSARKAKTNLLEHDNPVPSSKRRELNSREEAESGATKARRGPRSEKDIEAMNPSDGSSKETSRGYRRSAVKSILKVHNKGSRSPGSKVHGVVPIIRECSAEANLRNEVRQFLNTLPTPSSLPATERRILSELSEPEKPNFCSSLRSFFTFFEHKIHDVRYAAEFYDVDLRRVWLNPKFRDDFRIGPGSLVMERKIGSGSFGVVYCAESKKKYAIKCVRKKATKIEEGFKMQEKEFYVWRGTAGHPNIVSLYAAFETARAYCYVMDYVKTGSLHRVLRKTRLPDDVTRKIAAQLAHALHTVHALGCLHRDISCSNILITPSFDVLLSDFGISFVGLSAKTRCGSLAYMAPEVIACRTSGPGADWWSYGIVLFTMFEGMTPLSLYVKRWNIDLNRLSKQNRYEVAKNATVPINPLLEKGKRLLLKDLFRENPSERLGARNKMNFQPFREHEYFRGIDWTELDNALSRILKNRSKVPFI
ncbi:aurora kinase A-like [Galendromus occidentalis]|uniref:Aurora kinase A-like n=1 Tax=Galendromus occidentalis TaxID=34638 RepID=A0AAJ7SEW6_9ACAR|nr:aurora kinase A-like [Galendromus occidentalis]